MTDPIDIRIARAFAIFALFVFSFWFLVAIGAVALLEKVINRIQWTLSFSN
jgi:hypothetical protein